MGTIRIGNSGWSYRDWVGTFYPKNARSENFLGHYFDSFDTVEINSTFYRIPSRDTVLKWACDARGRKGKEYCIKVPQTISHFLSMEKEAINMNKAYDEFSKTVLEPLSENGVLGVVLFQASPYFTMRGDIKYKMKSEPSVPLPDYSMGIDRLSEICRMMKDHPGECAVELRNSSWLDEDSHLVASTIEVLRESGTALVTVDGPSFPWMTVDTSRHNYVRFHGRNKEGWFRDIGKDPSARYKYKYTRQELGERIESIKIMASKVDKETRVFFNNHPQGYAPQNALAMMELLGIERPSGALDSFR
jgi:uncharacterized protein YecE (DUF72 family)